MKIASYTQIVGLTVESYHTKNCWIFILIWTLNHYFEVSSKYFTMLHHQKEELDSENRTKVWDIHSACIIKVLFKMSGKPVNLRDFYFSHTSTQSGMNLLVLIRIFWPSSPRPSDHWYWVTRTNDREFRSGQRNSYVVIFCGQNPFERVVLLFTRQWVAVLSHFWIDS